MKSRIPVVVVSLGVLIGCSSSTLQGAGNASAVSGTIASGQYRLNNPVVLAQSNDGHVYVAPVSSTLSFHLQIRPGAAYRLYLANTTTSGKYRAISRINWPTSSGASRWARLSGPVRLGMVHVRGTSCTQNDNSQGDSNDQGQDDDEQDGAISCNATDQTDSDSDGDHQGWDGGQDNNCQGDDNEQGEHESDDDMSAKCGCVVTPSRCGGSGDDQTVLGQQQGTNEDDNDNMTTGTPSGDGGVCTPTTPPPGGSGGFPGADGGMGGTGGGTGGASADAGTTGGGSGSPCQVNGNCGTGLTCLSNVCTVPPT
jgi:hypothetical protein